MKTFTGIPMTFPVVFSVANNSKRQIYFCAIVNTTIALLGLTFILIFLTACDSNDVSGENGTLKNIPQNVTANPGTRTIELAWTGVSGASGYSVYWSNKAGVSKPQRTEIYTTLPHLQHHDLANGQPYYYVVTAHTSNGESRESVEISATPFVSPPASPSVVSARGGNARVTLTWKPISGATHYTLYWNTQGNVSATDARIDHVLSPFVHSDLSNDQDYYYILVAENIAGPSSASPEISARPRMNPPSAAVIEQLISAPGQVTLHWRNVSNASSYTLYWNTQGEVSTDDTAITQVTSPYTMTSLSNALRYYYRLQAHNAGGNSPLSNEAQATPPDQHHINPPGAVPDTPMDIRVSLGNGQLNLDWPTVEKALGYNLYWSTTVNDEIMPDATEVKKLTYLQPPYSHIGLNNGRTYHYRLSAFNHQGESALSPEINGTPQMIMPGVPAGVHAISGDERIAVRWNDVQAASGYTLYLNNQQGDNRTIPNVSSPYEAKGLSNNTTYDIQVTAHNTQGESGRSAVITATPHEPVPNAPQRLSARPGNGQVLLQWDSALAQDPNDSAQRIRGYRIYYDTRHGVSPANSRLLGKINNELDIAQTEDGRWQFNHTGIRNGQRYYYVVIAFNDGGDSGTSTEVWAYPEAPIHDAPSQVWAEAGDNQVLIHFTKVNSNATPPYNLYWNKQQTDTRSTTNVITNIQPGYRFSEGANTNGNTYYFRISAFNASGESTLSPEVSASPQMPAPARPPQDLQASVQSGQVTLNWSPLSDARGYVIYWSTDPKIDPNTSARFSGNEVQPGYQHTGLVNGQSYYYQITAVNPGGESALSQALIATPQINAPPTPSAPRLSAGDASVSIDFQAVDGATSYSLFWHTNPTLTLDRWSQKHGIQAGSSLANFNNGETYYFRLAANNAGGQSTPSVISSITPQAPTPAMPSDVSAIAGNGQISLNWHTQRNVSYTLYWSDNANVTPINSGNFIDNVRPSYTHVGLDNDTVYAYQLTARNNSGDSPATAAITATPTNPDKIPLAGLFADAGLQRCVDKTMTQTYAHEITSLTCNNDGISDLTGIKRLINLETLNLASNTLTHLDGLARSHLSSLTNLILDDNQLMDIRGLASADLSNLQRLNLADNALTDLDGFEKIKLDSLLFLQLKNNQLTNVNELADVNLSRLIDLRLDDNQLTDITGLENSTLSNLKSLNLARNDLTHLDSLVAANLSSLTNLPLDGNQLTDIRGLASAGLSNLQRLNLASNALAHLDGLAGAKLSSLTNLFLDNNQLTDITGLADAGLRNLQRLNLANNALTNLNRFAEIKLDSLTFLRLKNNQLTDVSELADANLSKLINLRLDDNQLTDITGLTNSTLSNLKSLNLARNALTHLNDLETANLSSLTHLYVNTNQLADMSGLTKAGLSNNLQTLFVYNNLTLSCIDLESLIENLQAKKITPSIIDDETICIAP
ncbi:MAG: hypothetical protein GXP08_03665 [Gammaproteobacteria bacterium]|nr:hypothetical protein [Gammaproteobacteria bacterium]